jgi:hypothetical protein
MEFDNSHTLKEKERKKDPFADGSSEGGVLGTYVTQ